MNKLFLLLFFTISFIISCSSCVKKEEQSDADTPPAPIVQPTLISRDNWQVTLPVGWIENHTALPYVVLFAHNADDKVVIFLRKVLYLGTKQELIALHIRDIHDQGANLISISEMEINGIKYALLEAAKADTKAWMWETTINSYRYNLLCAGAATDYATCLSLARSIVIR